MQWLFKKYLILWALIVVKFIPTLSGWRQHEMQYSYILQHPLSLQVSQANLLVLSDPVLQHPEDITSDLEHT